MIDDLDARSTITKSNPSGRFVRFRPRRVSYISAPSTNTHSATGSTLFVVRYALHDHETVNQSIDNLYKQNVGRSLSDVLNAKRMADLDKTLNEIARLPADWDGPGTITPSERTIQSAKKLIRSIPPGIPLPHVAPSSDGEIGFTWATARYRVGVDLSHDGQLMWFVKIDGALVGGNDEVDQDVFPPAVVAHLRQAYRR